jgi:hypothetical protein
MEQLKYLVDWGVIGVLLGLEVFLKALSIARNLGYQTRAACGSSPT